MSINTITVGTTDYTSYASLVEADDYLAVDAIRFDSWDALTDDQKRKMLISATRRMDTLVWKGEKTGGDSQVNQFPRTGLTYPSGSSTSTTEVPLDIEDATILLAGSMAMDAEGALNSSASNTKKVVAGSASVEYFKTTQGQPIGDALVYSIILPYLSASDSSTGNYVSGNDGISSFTDIDLYGRTT